MDGIVRGEGKNGGADRNAANDNGAEARVDAAVLTLARLLGRQIARDRFEGLDAANDNAPARKADEQ